MAQESRGYNCATYQNQAPNNAKQWRVTPVTMKHGPWCRSRVRLAHHLAHHRRLWRRNLCSGLTLLAAIAATTDADDNCDGNGNEDHSNDDNEHNNLARVVTTHVQAIGVAHAVTDRFGLLAKITALFLTPWRTTIVIKARAFCLTVVSIAIAFLRNKPAFRLCARRAASVRTAGVITARRYGMWLIAELTSLRFTVRGTTIVPIASAQVLIASRL
mmetsp:Transcript_13914/g.25651  ORF Transcript_13914/g.25651 Transcript_13914/m.25651 type:complete len:216 (-) Transcript_13914:677-1324(-)